jgi:hypothetical protein
MTTPDRGRVAPLNRLPEQEKDGSRPSTNGRKPAPWMPQRTKNTGSGGSGGGNPNNKPEQKRPRIPPWAIGVLFLGLLAYQLYVFFDPQREGERQSIPYSAIEQQIQDSNVTKVTLTENRIEADLEQPIGWDRENGEVVPPPAEGDRQIAPPPGSSPTCRRSRTPACCRSSSSRGCR